MEAANMTSPEIGEAIKKGYTTAVFAVGSNEQHGPVLAVCTDTVLGDVLALKVAEKLGKTLKFPTVNMGCSDHHMMFPGTVSLRKETLHMILKDYVGSLARHGFKRVVVLPSHGGNFGPISEVVDALKRENPGVRIDAYTDLIGFVEHITDVSKKYGISAEDSGAHAGESEVSMMMYANPKGVRAENIPKAKGYVGVFDEEATQKIFKDGIAALSKIGVLGDPAKASEAHGKEYVENLSDAIVELLKK
ncbi:creatininase family protein [Candidatus Bathyarchaeota archaeon]|nr:creatininase family protein [Candidatus Bathyarchaeota archaeon]